MLNISMMVENKRSEPMKYLYLCHVDFRPVDSAKLVYNAGCIKVHDNISDNLPRERAKLLQAYMEKGS